jgi:hypothetical protein
MTRKNTARCTEITPEPIQVREYLIGYQFNDKVICETVQATAVTPDCDELLIYSQVDGNEVQIGAYRDWKFYRMIMVNILTEQQ